MTANPTAGSVANPAVRERLAIALDLPDLDDALRLARDISPWFGVAKIGLELYSAAGPEAIRRMDALGLRVFCDLKLHDIPTTVGRAARVLGGLGVSYLNFHAAGGVEMLRAGVEGAREGARDAQRVAPVPIAVTVLTSDPDASAFDARLASAIESGCGGVV
ncbi:MAG: orotidine-5-phosphate decarboxylase, partial [Actinomycetota bacterium]|nr:orotidine-5-phosphate decarboxylase [Actinomycetota bacterium]